MQGLVTDSQVTTFSDWLLVALRAPFTQSSQVATMSNTSIVHKNRYFIVCMARILRHKRANSGSANLFPPPKPDVI